MKVSPARAAAFDILTRIEKDSAFSSALLPVYEEKLSEKDAALCHELTLGVLRRKLYLDAIVDRLSSGKRIDLEIRVLLRLGLFQVIELDRVPDHAAIDESVNLALRANKRSAKGFVNAILRTFQREPFVPKLSHPVDDLGVNTSHPQWLVNRWVEQFGFDRTEELCRANNDRPPVAWRVLNPAILKSVEAMVGSGLVRKSEYVDGVFIGSHDGRSEDFYLQDEGSLIVADAVAAETDGTVLDVCAAPGGKTTFLSADVEKVVAGDIHSNRVALLKEICERLNARNVQILQYDALEPLPFENRSFDVVFVDAPCSGTGTIRHNPEIRYSIVESDITELSDKQRRILKNASELVRENGKLIYSTCSLEREENEMVCEEFLRANIGFVSKRPKVADRFITDDGFARTFPARDNMDGFFIAVFERIQSS